MATCGQTNVGGTFSISTTAENSDLDLSGFEALTYTQVPGLVNHGTVGIQTNMIEDPAWDDTVICSSKGQSTGGAPDLEFRYAESAGLDALEAAGAPDNKNSYAFKVEYPNGRIIYWRGPIGGPEFTLGGPEDNQHVTFAARNNQVPVVVDASS
jgi:hypothetical protein